MFPSYIERRVYPNDIHAEVVSDSLIHVYVSLWGSFCIVEYDISGKIVQTQNKRGSIMDVKEMDVGRVSPVVTHKTYFLDDKTPLIKQIYYWGFDESGNLFVQVY